MTLDIAEAPAAPAPPAPAAMPAAVPVAAPAAAPPAARPADPPVRPRPRHRRRRRQTVARFAERTWRPPLALAVAIFAACGPAHALGHPDLVYYAVLVALVLSAVAVPLGCLSLRLSVPDRTESSSR